MKSKKLYSPFGELCGGEPECGMLSTSMTASFPYVHYSNPYWNEAHAIWGHGSDVPVKNLIYAYSDRLVQWDYKKDEEARRIASEKNPKFNPQFIQDYLTAYHDRPVLLRHVLAGVNVSNGYTYYVYGYEFADAKKSES